METRLIIFQLYTKAMSPNGTIMGAPLGNLRASIGCIFRFIAKNMVVPSYAFE